MIGLCCLLTVFLRESSTALRYFPSKGCAQFQKFQSQTVCRSEGSGSRLRLTVAIGTLPIHTLPLAPGVGRTAVTTRYERVTIEKYNYRVVVQKP